MNFIEYIDNIGYPKKLMNDVLSKKEKFVYLFKIKGKSQIAPKWELKVLQKILKDYLYEYYSKEFSENATAYIKCKNISYNLERHQGNNYFFKSDFVNFFPSISEMNVNKTLENILSMETNESLNLIKNILFYDNRLQFGFPSSPIISNLILKDFDKELESKLSLKNVNSNIKYSRYSDDITISSKYEFDKMEILNIIDEMITKFPYLKINRKKTRFFERYSHNSKITGLIPLSNRNTIGKRRFNDIKLNIYLLITNKPIQKVGLYNSVEQLSSFLSYLYMVDKSNYFRLKKYFSKNYLENIEYLQLFKK